uniref:Uncharacterized protein n=1 Tax=Schistocephalus solidus TaxID=70667 RepID=A0A0X3Q1R9_SCHSO
MFHPPSVNGFRRVEHCMRCGSVNSPLLHGYTSGNYPPNKHLYDIRTRRRRATQPPAFSSRPINLNLSCQLQSPTLAIILPLILWRDEKRKHRPEILWAHKFRFDFGRTPRLQYSVPFYRVFSHLIVPFCGMRLSFVRYPVFRLNNVNKLRLTHSSYS